MNDKKNNYLTNYNLVLSEYHSELDRLKSLDTKANMLLVFCGVLLSLFYAIVSKVPKEEMDTCYIVLIFIFICLMIATLICVILCFFPRKILDLDTKTFQEYNVIEGGRIDYLKYLTNDIKTILDSSIKACNRKAECLLGATVSSLSGAVVLIILMIVNIIG